RSLQRAAIRARIARKTDLRGRTSIGSSQSPPGKRMRQRSACQSSWRPCSRQTVNRSATKSTTLRLECMRAFRSTLQYCDVVFIVTKPVGFPCGGPSLDEWTLWFLLLLRRRLRRRRGIEQLVLQVIVELLKARVGIAFGFFDLDELFDQLV